MAEMEFLSANREARFFKCLVCESTSVFPVSSATKPTCQNPDCSDYLGLQVARAAIFDEPRASATVKDQPPPKPVAGPAIQDLVLVDVAERKRVGIERYGQPVLPHNGRNALVDLYQELLDAVMYTRQLIYEQEHPVVVVPGIHRYELPDTSAPLPCAICGRDPEDAVHE